jgi:hypothetical protein
VKKKNELKAKEEETSKEFIRKSFLSKGQLQSGTDNAEITFSLGTVKKFSCFFCQKHSSFDEALQLRILLEPALQVLSSGPERKH